jgi:hypothetical protein
MPTVAQPMIGRVVWTTSVDARTGAPADEVSTYPPDAVQIVAAVHATSLPANATVNADWTYNNTTLDAFATQVTVDSSSPDRWIVFRLERSGETSWPAGAYAIAISLNGDPVASSSVQVAPA